MYYHHILEILEKYILLVIQMYIRWWSIRSKTWNIPLKKLLVYLYAFSNYILFVSLKLKFYIRYHHINISEMIKPIYAYIYSFKSTIDNNLEW